MVKFGAGLLVAALCAAVVVRRKNTRIAELKTSNRWMRAQLLNRPISKKVARKLRKPTHAQIARHTKAAIPVRMAG